MVTEHSISSLLLRVSGSYLSTQGLSLRPLLTFMLLNLRDMRHCPGNNYAAAPVHPEAFILLPQHTPSLPDRTFSVSFPYIFHGSDFFFKLSCIESYSRLSSSFTLCQTPPSFYFVAGKPSTEFLSEPTSGPHLAHVKTQIQLYAG